MKTGLKKVQLKHTLITIANDFVFSMTGYHSDFDFLEKIGIEVSPEGKVPCFSSETFETNKKGIFLAGVVCGGMDTGKLFIENSLSHPTDIFNYLQKEKRL